MASVAIEYLTADGTFGRLVFAGGADEESMLRLAESLRHGASFRAGRVGLEVEDDACDLEFLGGYTTSEAVTEPVPFREFVARVVAARQAGWECDGGRAACRRCAVGA